MKPDEVRKLLGGYATGTLTDAERSLLLSAALDDQALFDALADEDALRELLADPAARQELLTELKSTPTPQLLPWEQPDLRNLLAANIALPASAPPPSARPATPAMGSAAELLANSRPKSAWASFLESLTPRRLALAGAFAAVLLVIGAVSYLGHSDKTVELALNKPPASLPPQPADVSKEQTQLDKSASETRVKAKSSSQGPDTLRSPVAEELAAQKAAQRALGVPPPAAVAAPAPAPPPLPITPSPFVEPDSIQGNSVPRENADRGKQVADERRAAPPAEGRASAGGSLTGLSNAAATSEKDLEKKAEEQAAAQARNEAQPTKRVDSGTASTVTLPERPAAGSPASGKDQQQSEQDKAKAAPRASAQAPGGLGGALGGFRQAPPPQASTRVYQGKAQPAPAQANALSSNPDRLKQMAARVDDVNGTILSISVGTNAGLKAGDTLEILRGDRPIGTVRLTEVGASFAVGPFLPTSANADAPRSGDRVQRAPATQPVGR